LLRGLDEGADTSGASDQLHRNRHHQSEADSHLDSTRDERSRSWHNDLGQEWQPAKTKRSAGVDDEDVDLANAVPGVDEHGPEGGERDQARGHPQTEAGNQDGNRDERQGRKGPHRAHQDLGCGLCDA
jgi:hypothetical protein